MPPIVALISWPLIAMALASRLGRTVGLIWALLLGALFLPEAYNYDLPGLPPLDKDMAIVLGLLGAIFITRSAFTQGPARLHTNANTALVGDRFARAVVLGLPVLVIISIAATVFNNGDVVVDGPVRIPALGVRELISMSSQSVLLIAIYLAAQRYLSTPEHHVLVLQAFVLAGLAYSLLILFEVRMSPQLHTWIYGYFQSGWKQHLRGGAFRPIVFLQHGLFIGFFLITCTMAAFILLKRCQSIGKPAMIYILMGFWFFGVLVLSRNFGATLLALVFIPLVWFLGVRAQMWLAVGLVSFFMLFPALRQSGTVTMERPLEWVGSISVDRQESFAHRLENEERFMARQALKPVTGWGIWGRWRVRDPITGEDISTSDSRWMSILGERGWLGFIAYFGMLVAPVLLLLRARKRRDIPPETMGIAMILAATVTYQLANNTIGPMTMIFAGALAGFVWRPAAQEALDEAAVASEAVRKRAAYTRFPTGPDTPDAQTETLPTAPASPHRLAARHARPLSGKPPNARPAGLRYARGTS